MVQVAQYGRVETTETSATEHPLLLRVEEAARLLSISRSKVYELISAGQIRVVHIDRSVRVPVEGLREFIERLRT